MAAFAIERLAQIEIEGLLLGLGRQAQAFLQGGEILCQWRRGKILGHLAEPVTEMPAALDDPEIHRVAVAEHRNRGIVVLGECRYRAPAHRGQRFGQPAGLDDVRRGNGHVFIAQQPCGAGEPLGAERLTLIPQQLVPDGRFDTRAVARTIRQAFVGPGYPGRLGRDPGHSLEQCVVGFRARHGCQARRMPRAADHGDALMVRLRRADAPAHVGLAPLLLERHGFRELGAQGGHHFVQRLEDFEVAPRA